MANIQVEIELDEIHVVSETEESIVVCVKPNDTARWTDQLFIEYVFSSGQVSIMKLAAPRDTFFNRLKFCFNYLFRSGKYNMSGEDGHYEKVTLDHEAVMQLSDFLSAVVDDILTTIQQNNGDDEEDAIEEG